MNQMLTLNSYAGPLASSSHVILGTFVVEGWNLCTLNSRTARLCITSLPCREVFFSQLTLPYLPSLERGKDGDASSLRESSSSSALFLYCFDDILLCSTTKSGRKTAGEACTRKPSSHFLLHTLSHHEVKLVFEPSFSTNTSRTAKHGKQPPPPQAVSHGTEKTRPTLPHPSSAPVVRIRCHLRDMHLSRSPYGEVSGACAARHQYCKQQQYQQQQ